MRTQLQAKYTHVKSHYGKAYVINLDNKLQLQSYGTTVAEVNDDGSNLRIFGTYSQTTLRHLKDFINQFSDKHVNNNDDIRNLT